LPKLLIIQGTRHRFQEIGKKKTIIGTSPKAAVVLDPDPDISPRHSEIEYADHRYHITDMKSRSGTFVNNVQILTYDLSPGDRIQVGKTTLFFLESEEDGHVSETLRERLMERLRKAPRLEQRLTAISPEKYAHLLILQEINKAINSELDLDRLLELIMESAINLVNAERGFLILVQNGQLHFEVARNIDREMVDKPGFSISRTIIGQVVATGEPIRTTDAQTDFGHYQSVAAQAIRSLLCVPLKVKQKIIGTLYLDSKISTGSFSEEAVYLLSAFGDQAAIAIENARLMKELRAKERIEHELRIASRIQQDLLPKQNPELEGLLVHGRMITAKAVGGDYYDFIRSPSGHLFISIGDVSGKGVPAGLIMVMARSILRPLIASHSSTRTILVKTNKILVEDLEPSMFMSMLLLRYSPKSGKLQFTGAGHENLIIYRAKSKVCQVIRSGGIVLGAIQDVEHMLEEKKTLLETGDTVLLYTDGSTEARNEKGKELGLKGLRILMEKYAHLPPRDLVVKILDKIKKFAGAAEQHDDITLVALKKV
jgi:serine phosphatase RsbU (regulator of sigma subunit)